MKSSIQQILDDALVDDSSLPGAIVYVIAPQLNFNAGMAAASTGFKSVKGISAQQPVRIASNTKTFVAAAILRLWEKGSLQLNDPIDKYLLPASIELLEADGYETNKITVLQLLTHTSGLFDYAESDLFDAVVQRAPHKRWTRYEQLLITVEWGDPLDQPGEEFEYSDTGYILLGEILEEVTGESLPGAVRGLLDFEKLGIQSLWWETLEQEPAGLPERVHQYWGKADSYDWDPSFDLYGGGGLAGTMGDLALFVHRLFAGDVFHQRDTLELMLSGTVTNDGDELDLEDRSGYGMGIRTLKIDGRLAYGHSGAWGTTVAYLPELDTTIAVAAPQLLSDAKEDILQEVVILLDN